MLIILQEASNLNYWTLLLVIIFHYETTAVNSSMWSWECMNQKCVPLWVTDTSDTSSVHLQSLITCNMMCSRHAPLWPQPTGIVVTGKTAVPVRADDFSLNVMNTPSMEVNEHIRGAFKLFLKELKIKELNVNNYSKEFHPVHVRVTVSPKGDKDPRLLVNTDESYSLFTHMKDDAILADIMAKSFCGARHGLETLSQLVWYDPLKRSLFATRTVSIEDEPRFSYRGLMLDTSSNFFPVADLIRTIDAMAACKLNTFHWHISGSKSFPLQLLSVPQLAEAGAYSPEAVYSATEVRAVVQHARLRGIRVVIEVDAPAHVGRAWNWGHNSSKEYLALCTESSADNCEPPCGQLNPRNPFVYELLKRIYNELIEITGVTDVFHLGGDDISEKCWSEHFKNIDTRDLWVEFTQNSLINLAAKNHMPNLTILWSSKLDDRLKTHLKKFLPNIGLQVRESTWSAKPLSGIRTVASHEDAWDLNTGFGKWFEEADGAPYISWQQVYEHRPWGASDESWLGGEATVWAAHPGGLDRMVWPRAAALAERLWSDRAETVTRSVQARLDVHRERMQVKGVNIAPIWSMWCTHNPYTCG